MKAAVLSDLHGNFEAFQTCVNYALARGIRNFWFLGDYLGEFGFPQKTMELLYQLRETCECVFVKGNKEDYWLSYSDLGGKWKETDSTTGCMYYTYHNLTERDLAFFSSLEISQKLYPQNEEAVMLCHGSPDQVREILLPGSEAARRAAGQCGTGLLLCGHTHVQCAMEYEGTRILNPGSVGVPFFSDGKAQFLILHSFGGKWHEEFVSLTYDVDKEIAGMRQAGLDRKACYWYRITAEFLRGGRSTPGAVLEKAMELCREETGSCVWPDIPERYWEKAYEWSVSGRDEVRDYFSGGEKKRLTNRPCNCYDTDSL